MKKFPTNETTKIRQQTIVPPICDVRFSVVGQIDPYAVVFMFTDFRITLLFLFLQMYLVPQEQTLLYLCCNRRNKLPDFLINEMLM